MYYFIYLFIYLLEGLMLNPNHYLKHLYNYYYYCYFDANTIKCLNNWSSFRGDLIIVGCLVVKRDNVVCAN